MFKANKVIKKCKYNLTFYYGILSSMEIKLKATFRCIIQKMKKQILGKRYGKIYRKC